MKFIKSYKIFESSNSELDKELKNYNIENYIINEDGSIDCNQTVFISAKKLNVIPFKFNKVSGGFGFSFNNLTSLENCPKYIGRYFDCGFNELTTLEYGPWYVGGDYYCQNNKLQTLKGCVSEVYGDFFCHDNRLVSLEFCPMQIEGDFNCSRNKLIELDMSPFIRGGLYCAEMFDSKPKFFGHCEKLVW